MVYESGRVAEDGATSWLIEGASRGHAKIAGQNTQYEIAGFVGIDREHDLALLKIQGAKAPVLPIGDSSDISVGDEVYAVGNPLGLEGTFSQGIVSGIRPIGSGILLQITAPISPGSSDPVLNAKSQVIGIVVGSFRDGQNLNFAVPVAYLLPLLATMATPTPLSHLP